MSRVGDTVFVGFKGLFGVLCAASLTVVACTPTGARERLKAAAGTPQEDVCGEDTPTPAELDAATPLVIVQTRDHEIMVYPARGGLAFTIALAGTGLLLAERIDEDAFRAGFPGLHDHFERAFADEHGHSGAWAGL